MNISEITAEECAELIRKAAKIVALTGAGISTAAGIPDFRGPKGLYVTRKYDPDTVFDIDYFHRDPEPFYAFTRDFMAVVDTLKPTFTHTFLAALEEKGKLRGLVTQNIDPLHQIAGSKKIIPMHGNYFSSTCTKCRTTFSYEELLEMLGRPEVPRCSCGGVIKPDVVFFGEAVNGLFEAQALVSECDLLLCLGSSLTVYPAAALPAYADGEVVVVNKGHVSVGRPHRFSERDLDEFFGIISDML